jgi:hypothetical protein
MCLVAHNYAGGSGNIRSVLVLIAFSACMFWMAEILNTILVFVLVGIEEQFARVVFFVETTFLTISLPIGYPYLSFTMIVSLTIFQYVRWECFSCGEKCNTLH